MKIKQILLYFIPFIIVLCGCGSQIVALYVINPDMSGKCIFQEKIAYKDIPEVQMHNYWNNDTSKTKSIPYKIDSNIILKAIYNRVNTAGVEAWNNANFTIKNDTVFFSGTAYFKDLSKVQGLNAGIDNNNRDTLLYIYHRSKGEIVFELKNHLFDKKPNTKPVIDTLAEIDSARKMVPPFLKIISQCVFNDQISYSLPGKIISSHNFTTTNANTANTSISVNQWKYFYNKTLASDSLMRQMMRSPNYTYNKITYGEYAPCEIAFNLGTKPQFNYNQEVSAAKINFQTFKKQSGLEKYDLVLQAAIQKQKNEKAIAVHRQDSIRAVYKNK